MADPISSHIISGKVRDIFGNILEGATVTVTHDDIKSANPLDDTTNAQGEYSINLSGLSEQWVAGEGIKILGSKTAEGRKTITTTISTGGGQTHNFNLDETSDFDFELQPDLQDRYAFSMVMFVHYDGLQVTRLRPLPVQTENPLDGYHPTDDDVSGNTQYTGYTDRFGNWYIQRYNSSNGQYRYARGSSDYTTNWDNRSTSVEYDYFYNVF